MTKHRTLAISTISLLTLGVFAMGCGEMDDSGDQTVTSALQDQEWTAFQRNDHALMFETSGGVFSSNSGAFVATGTVPSQVKLSGGAVVAGFQRNDGHWVVDQFTPNNSHSFTITNGLIRGGTSPGLALCAGCSLWAFGFQGTDGRLWFGTGGNANNGNPTAAFLAAGTSPSFAMTSSGVVQFGFMGVNGHLWVGLNGITSGVDSTHGVATGTSPSVGVGGPNNLFGVAFQGSNGHLWFGGGGQSQFDKSSIAIKTGTSPTLAVAADGTRTFVAYQSAANGVLHVWRNENGAESDSQINLGMQNTATPKITPILTSGYQIALKGFNGHLWIVVNSSGGIGQEQIQDQGFAM